MHPVQITIENKQKYRFLFFIIIIIIDHGGMKIHYTSIHPLDCEYRDQIGKKQLFKGHVHLMETK
jgi:hypothetical protein